MTDTPSFGRRNFHVCSRKRRICWPCSMPSADRPWLRSLHQQPARSWRSAPLRTGAAGLCVRRATVDHLFGLSAHRGGVGSAGNGSVRSHPRWIRSVAPVGRSALRDLHGPRLPLGGRLRRSATGHGAARAVAGVDRSRLRSGWSAGRPRPIPLLRAAADDSSRLGRDWNLPPTASSWSAIAALRDLLGHDEVMKPLELTEQEKADSLALLDAFDVGLERHQFVGTRRWSSSNQQKTRGAELSSACMCSHIGSS